MSEPPLFWFAMAGGDLLRDVDGFPFRFDTEEEAEAAIIAAGFPPSETAPGVDT